MSSILIKNGTIVNEGKASRGDLLIKDDSISAIGIINPEIVPGEVKIINADRKSVV